MNTNTNRLALSKQDMQKTQKIKLNQNQQSSVDMCPVVTVHSCVTQLLYRTVSMIFPVILQSVVIAEMLAVGGERS